MADGGANQLYDMLSKWPSSNGTKAVLSDFVPDIIEGDLDSIRPDVREFYRRLGTRQALLLPYTAACDLRKCHQLSKFCGCMDASFGVAW